MDLSKTLPREVLGVSAVSAEDVPVEPSSRPMEERGSLATASITVIPTKPITIATSPARIPVRSVRRLVDGDISLR